MLAPAYNEALTVTESVRSLLTLRYPSLEVVVVNDGSSDDDARACWSATSTSSPSTPRRTAPARGRADPRRVPLAAHARLVVVDKVNGGKADALNAGLDVAAGELVCAIDADTLVEPDALQRMVAPVPGRATTWWRVGGTIRVVNGCEVDAGRVIAARAPRKPLEALQAVEYLRAFLAGRLGWNRLGGNLDHLGRVRPVSPRRR